ncbi:hypothetical protein GIS00_20550 [Nakamurella sp. YIM 132087]|uniref:Uncharacterized protein n=1 Tax=Nakamurella alba TaxID=2665158 RepID=A0A7K1FQA6_9ACTN|nr:hypothetical protein [Nakamurella alba]MTD16335.1 hypothetical protein [Nakamurella alba]
MARTSGGWTRGAAAIGAMTVIGLLAGCTSGGSSARSTVTTTVEQTRTTAVTVTVTTSSSIRTPPPPSTTPTVGPGTELGAQDADMQYGAAVLNPLQPCEVLDPDAGDLVDLPLEPSDSTPNSCVAFDDGKGFGVKVEVGDMADAIDTVKRCFYADDDQDQCDLPDIIDDYDARTFVRDGVTVITEDVINGDDGYLGANVAAAKNAWVQITVHFDGGLTPVTDKIRMQLVDQVIAHSKGA